MDDQRAGIFISDTTQNAQNPSESVDKTKEDKRKQFYEILSQTTPKNPSIRMNLEKYNKMIKQVKDARNGTIVINKHWLLKHYDVLGLDGQERLIYPMTNSQIRYYIPLEQLYDILYETHQNIGHGGRDRMRKELQQNYKNITYTEIQTFLNLCELCLQKRKTECKPRTESRKVQRPVKPITSPYFNSRCQVDLIDFESQADGEFKFIMVYQDHLTKFVVLRALKTKTPDEIASQILDIFHIFGAPTVLQSNNGRAFCSHIIQNLKSMWPSLRIVHGEAKRGQQLMGSVERAIQDVRNMLATWMLDQRCKNWSEGLAQVQFMKNRAFHSDIRMSPFMAMFGHDPKVGLSSTNLPRSVAGNLVTEEDLGYVLSTREVLEEKDPLLIEDMFLEDNVENAEIVR